MTRFLIHLCGIGIFKPEYVSGKFNYCTLHTQTYSEKRNVIFTGILHSSYFSF